MIYLILASIIIVLLLFWFFKKLEKNTQNNVYKIANISNDLGANYYKIVAKRKSSDKEFKEFDEFPVIKSNIAPKILIKYAKSEYKTKEEANKALNNFLIHLGKNDLNKKLKVQ